MATAAPDGSRRALIEGAGLAAVGGECVRSGVGLSNRYDGYVRRSA